MKTPSWLKKPRYRSNVVPSERGWIVESTGELLVSVVNMLSKMESLGITLEDEIEDINDSVEMEWYYVDTDDNDDADTNNHSTDSNDIADVDEKQILIDALMELGIKKDKRSSVETLKKLLEENKNG